MSNKEDKTKDTSPAESSAFVYQTPTRKIPLSLGKVSLKSRLEAYYSLISPDVLKDQNEWRSKFEQIYQKYGGSHDGERKLGAKLAKKYGSTVRLLLAETASTPEKVESVADQQEKQKEEWYDLRPSEKNSGDIRFTSDSFDPEAALKTSQEDVVKANPWLTNSRLLDYCDQFRSFLPTNDPMFRERTRKRGLLSPSSTPGESPPKKKQQQPASFVSIAENYQSGPYSVLYRCFTKRQRVRVVIRYVNCLRGTVTGHLIAFDKHMNMLLRDCEEWYSLRAAETHKDCPPLSNEEIELKRRRSALAEAGQNDDSGGSERWCIRQRRMKQILLRGDNVVMVYKAESERSTWPKTSRSPKESIYGRPSRTEELSADQRVGTVGSLGFAVLSRTRPSPRDIPPRKTPRK